jgi:hypothetical protein
MPGGYPVLPFVRTPDKVARQQWYAVRRTAAGYLGLVSAAVMIVVMLTFAKSDVSLKSVLRSNLESLHDRLHSALELELAEQFRSNLAHWEGDENWAKTWAVRSDSLVTGQLALYGPSRNMSNYRMEFSGLIEKKSLGWVFRASDPKNYYAMKFTVAQAGPRPRLSVVRYSVIDGKKSEPIQIPMNIMVHNETPYHVAMQIEGRSFTTSLEGQVVDTWSDDRLRAGGIGFFSDSGERARLFWMKLWNNDDFLGRLSSSLALSIIRPPVWMQPAFTADLVPVQQ